MPLLDTGGLQSCAPHATCAHNYATGLISRHACFLAPLHPLVCFHMLTLGCPAAHHLLLLLSCRTRRWPPSQATGAWSSSSGPAGGPSARWQRPWYPALWTLPQQQTATEAAHPAAMLVAAATCWLSLQPVGQHTAGPAATPVWQFCQAGWA